MKKFVCPVCGYVLEAEAIPEGFVCPVCKVPGSKFKVMVENKLSAEHELGIYEKTVANSPDISAEDKAYILEQLKANFTGECSEVGMYLCMARIAHREGYPEIGPVLGEGRPRGSRARRQVRRDPGRGSGAPHEGHHQGQAGMAR